MSVTDLLKEYINKCDIVLSNNNNNEAKELVNDIINTFDKEFEGLTDHLDIYKRSHILKSGLKNSYQEVAKDYMKDLERLKSRLILELEKKGSEADVQASHMEKDSKNDIVYQYQYVINNGSGSIQYQKDTVDSIQIQNIEYIDYEKVKDIISQIEKYKEPFKEALGEQQGKEVEPLLKEAKEAIENEDSGRLKKAWKSISSLAGGIAENLIAAGVIGLLGMIPQLF